MSTVNLLGRPLPAQGDGFENVTSNLGELANRGFEATLGAVNIKQTQFHLEVQYQLFHEPE